ncbi:protein mono-ADP-ribosyltransferase PARP12 [Parambassis ranga]|uniref:Protein mono-ADP-ribosyltransferase PARP12 n=1 Tax=Parambassis ranga TaxID=210632 RepID=A0A6P7IHS9_9TELE|nr:protein mono-ADP-ribosyltransferase PARP12 [Parambassis ranga]
MASSVSKLIIKILCDNQGSLDFRELDVELARSFTVADSVLRSVLFDDGKIAILRGKEPTIRGQFMSPDSVVVAKTSLRLCQKRECTRCDGLHLCRYFVCGDCNFGSRCKNSHSLASPHNAEVLRRSGLHDLTEKQLFQLLLQNDPFLLPEICPHYNKGDGLYGSCRFTTSCTKLHVCQHFFQDDCKFGNSCKRQHSINTGGMKHFQGYSQEILHKIYRNKLIITQEGQATVAPVPTPQPSQQQASRSNPGSPTSVVCPTKPKTDADRSEICLYFIRGHCSFKETCVRVHWLLPYRWQVLDSNGETWKDLPNMEEVEKAYCDPAQNTSCMDQPSSISGLFRALSFQSSASPNVQSVDFKTMTCGGSPVRRLSTASSVLKPPHYILTTEWVWYWRDDGGAWLEFGLGDSDKASTITSQTLENVYLADKDAAIPFSAGKQHYVLHFKDGTRAELMYQENLKHKTRREVRRRPRFVSTQDVAVKKSPPLVSTNSTTAGIVPPNWDKSALPEYGYKLIHLPKTASDYKSIETLFQRTMPTSRINSIQRIQNPSLWKVFQWQEEQMKKKNGGNSINRLYLFHGTEESLIEAICEQNFDWRMCGVHGTAYGKGSYFARDASYSDRYARAKGRPNKIVFVALVLVGEYTKGNSAYARPPSKGPGTMLYDSCVDNQSNPSIYVIFEKHQIYPEYVINYS